MIDLTRVPVRWRAEAALALDELTRADEHAAALRAFRASLPDAPLKVFAYSAVLTEGGAVVMGRVPARSWQEAAAQVALHWYGLPAGQKFGDALLTGTDHTPPDPELAKPKKPGPVTRTILLFGHAGPGAALVLPRLKELDGAPLEPETTREDDPG